MKQLKYAMPYKKLLREIREAKKDPEFVKAIKEFINQTSGRLIYKV